jgi:hypothetical protein
MFRKNCPFIYIKSRPTSIGIFVLGNKGGIYPPLETNWPFIKKLNVELDVVQLLFM